MAHIECPHAPNTPDERTWLRNRVQRLELKNDTVYDRMVHYRSILEQLISEIAPNLGTHDHTDWELRRMVDRAEAAMKEV